MRWIVGDGFRGEIGERLTASNTPATRCKVGIESWEVSHVWIGARLRGGADRGGKGGGGSTHSPAAPGLLVRPHPLISLSATAAMSRYMSEHAQYRNTPYRYMPSGVSGTPPPSPGGGDCQERLWCRHMQPPRRTSGWPARPSGPRTSLCPRPSLSPPRRCGVTGGRSEVAGQPHPTLMLHQMRRNASISVKKSSYIAVTKAMHSCSGHPLSFGPEFLHPKRFGSFQSA